MVLPDEEGKKSVFKTNAMAPAWVEHQDGAHPGRGPRRRPPRYSAKMAPAWVQRQDGVRPLRGWAESPQPACGPGRVLALVPAAQADPGG